jgi:hypothetical protein
MNTKTASYIIGIIFIAVGLAGFLPNPVVGASHDSIFYADAVHNIAHIESGVLFLLIAFAAPSRAASFLKVFGIVYLLLGIIGLLAIGSAVMSNLLGFLQINGADNYLHIGLGISIFFAGMLPQGRETTSTARI